MSRSFTIDAVYKSGSKIRFDGGRYLSETPSAAASKAFSMAYRHLKSPKGRFSLVIHMAETTRGSAKKIYKYRVTRIAQSTEVERNGQTFIYKYITKVKAI